MIRPAEWLHRANSSAGRVVVLAAVGALAGAVMRLVGARPVAALVGAGVGLAALLRWWPGSAVALLLISAALNRFTFAVGGADLKPEHMATITVAGLLALHWAAARGPRPAGRDDEVSDIPSSVPSAWAPACLGVYLGANLLSSLVNAPHPTESLRLVGLVTLVTVPYFLLPPLIRDGGLLRRVVLGWFALAAVEAASGIAIMVLYRQGIDLGVQTGLGSPPVPVGTMREGNIYGSYVAATTAACLAWLLGRGRPRWAAAVGAAGALTLGGVAISLARGAWLGLGAGAGLVLLLRWRVAARRGAALALLAVAGLPLLLTVAETPFLAEARFYIEQRLTSLNPDTILNDNTVAERLDTYAKAQEGIADHPLIGNGTGSFGQRYYYLSIQAPAWIGNLELHLLYDTGLLGLLAFGGFLLATACDAWRAYHAAPAAEARALLLGLGAGLVVLLVAYQATEATWLAFTWVHLGLLRAACCMLRD